MEPRKREPGDSEFERVAGKNASLPRDALAFLAENRKWWLLPIMAVFLLTAVLGLVSTSMAGPFVYTFF